MRWRTNNSYIKSIKYYCRNKCNYSNSPIMYKYSKISSYKDCKIDQTTAKTTYKLFLAVYQKIRNRNDKSLKDRKTGIKQNFMKK